MTRGPAKPISARGSARTTSPSIAKLAVTPPVVGSVRTEMYGSRCVARRARADAVPIFLGVLEGQRIGRRQPGVTLLERARIGEHRDALARGDPERIVALGADAAGALHLGAVHDLLAGVALDPQPLGDDDLAR